MKTRSAFLINAQELANLSFEFLYLVESHHPICEWLRPYEFDENTCKIALMYRERFESRICSLIVSIAANLRILDDNKSFSELISAKGEDWYSNRIIQNGVGHIKLGNSEWKKLNSARTLFNYILHADSIKLSESMIKAEKCRYRAFKALDDIVIINKSVPSKNKNGSIKFSLRNFARYLFDIVEAMEMVDDKSGI